MSAKRSPIVAAAPTSLRAAKETGPMSGSTSFMMGQLQAQHSTTKPR